MNVCMLGSSLHIYMKRIRQQKKLIKNTCCNVINEINNNNKNNNNKILYNKMNQL